MTVPGTSRLTACLVAPLAVAAIAGCGGGGGGTTTSAKPPGDPKVAKEVPSAISKKGTLMVASDPTYPPNESIAPDGHTIIGMDPDLATALGGVMGLKVNVVQATFDGILPGLASGKFDLGMSSLGDTREREKTVDFVTYLKAGTSFYVKAKGGPTINTLADLCGHRVAVEKGTTQQNDAAGQDKKCRSAGRTGVTVLTFPDQNGANLALSSGRADVGMADSPPAIYQVSKSAGQFKLVGRPYGVVPYGIALAKHSGLATPVRDALKVLMTQGSYQTTLKKWGLSSSAIKNPTINGATS